MIINLIESVDIKQFEKRVGVQLVVDERPITSDTVNSVERFYARFPSCDILDGQILSGTIGNGNTIDDAITDYCRQISNRVLVFNAYTDRRREVKAPNVFYEAKRRSV